MKDAELMSIRNELEVEKLKQKQWEVAKEQLCKTREHAEQEHARTFSYGGVRGQGRQGQIWHTGQSHNQHSAETSMTTTEPGRRLGQ